MSDFRKWFTVLAVVALFLGTALTAGAQTTVSCSATPTGQAGVGGQPPIVRAEGLTELVGDVILSCTGTGTAPTGNVVTANIQIFLNTNITSKLVSATTGESTATLLLAGNINPANTAAAIHGVQVTPNSIAWNGVAIPFVTTGTTLRISSVRANVFNYVGAPPLTSLIPPQIIELISVTTAPVTGTEIVPVTLNNPQQTVGYVQQGLTFGVADTGVSYLQCQNVNVGSLDNGVAGTLEFKEGFASSFKTLDQEQDIQGTASNATMLQARFTGVAAGLTLYVPTTLTATGGSATITAASGTAGTGAFSALTAIPVAADGTATATWTVTAADPSAVQTYAGDVVVSYTANPGSDLPTINQQAKVSGNFAPVSTVGTASVTAAIPRFADITSTPVDVFAVKACSTNLLFPFVTNQAGFDTGVAISNTSADPFGTAHAQKGSCTLNFYGAAADGGSAPPAQTSDVINAGEQAVMLLSGGGTFGLTGAPGFQGYMIATCNFQFAHGFAYVTDLGSSHLGAMGYLALVLDASSNTANTLNRTGQVGENLNQ